MNCKAGLIFFFVSIILLIASVFIESNTTILFEQCKSSLIEQKDEIDELSARIEKLENPQIPQKENFFRNNKKLLNRFK